MKYLGILILVLAALGMAAFYGYKKTDDESTLFVKESIDAMAQAWDSQAFISRADPGLVQSMNTHGGVSALFAEYSKLGKLKSVDCDLINTAPMEVASKKYLAATYHCNAAYEAGPATIAITVRKGDNQQSWQIYYVKIVGGQSAE